MPNPVIMLIDDDQAVLNAVERDVRAKFGHDYRIVKANSGATALEFLKKLQQPCMSRGKSWRKWSW